MIAQITIIITVVFPNHILDNLNDYLTLLKQSEPLKEENKISCRFAGDFILYLLIQTSSLKCKDRFCKK